MTIENETINLIQNLTDPDELTRGNAVIMLSQLRHNDQALFRDTPAQDAFWRNVYHNLASFGDNRAVSHWAQRADVAIALTYPQPEQNHALRMIILNSHLADVRLTVLRALGLNQDINSVEVFIKLTEDSDPSIRAGAVEALGRLRLDNYCELFIHFLDDPSLVVRYAAINALALLGNEKAISILENLLFTQSDRTKKIDVLKAIVRPEAAIDEQITIEMFLKLVEQEENEMVLYSVALAVAKLKSDESLTILNKLLQHSSEHVQQGAKKALDLREMKAEGE